MRHESTNELLQFRDFIDKRLNNGSKDLSPEEALDEWRETQPEADEAEDTVAAIQEALDDMANGDPGRSADELIAEIRSQYGLPKSSRLSRHCACKGRSRCTIDFRLALVTFAEGQQSAGWPHSSPQRKNSPKMRQRLVLIPENVRSSHELRHVLFKTRRGRVYRAIFTIVGEEVRVPPSSTSSQQPIRGRDLPKGYAPLAGEEKRTRRSRLESRSGRHSCRRGADICCHP